MWRKSDIFTPKVIISFVCRSTLSLQCEAEAQVHQRPFLVESKKKSWLWKTFFLWRDIIWLPWQPVDSLHRAPGDEEAHEENMIVSKGKMSILTLSPWHKSVIEFLFAGVHWHHFYTDSTQKHGFSFISCPLEHDCPFPNNLPGSFDQTF